jgi:cobalt/nickel transport system permease protein
MVRKLVRDQRLGVFIGGFSAAWLSIFVASLGVGLQLAFSGTLRADLGIPALAAIHALIGVGEGLITLGALAFLYAARRDLLKLGGFAPSGGALVWVAGLVIAVALAVLSPLASANPDGFEAVAKQQGFSGRQEGPTYSIIPDYLFPGLSNEGLATIIAGVLGTVIVFGVALATAYTRRKRQPTAG